MDRAKRLVLGLSVLVASVAVGTVVNSAFDAGAAGPSTTYYGCVSTKGALSKVGTTPPVCPKGSSQISWNSTGAPGADGTGVTTTAVSVGDANCPNGGVTVTAASGTSYVCNGADGSPGAQGPPGAPGTPGTPGAPGAAGVNGSTILSGGGAPTNAVGSLGDYYLDTTGRIFYGPKRFACTGTGCFQYWPTPGLALGSAQGTPGPSHVYFAQSPGGETAPLVLTTAETAVVTLPIPAAGNYFVSAPVDMINGDSSPQTATCHLYVNYDGSFTNVLDTAVRRNPAPLGSSSDVLEGTVYYTGPGYAVVTCSGFQLYASARISATLDGGNN